MATRWAYLTRANSEHDLIDFLGDGADASTIGVGVVLAKKREEGETIFARQAMRTTGKLCVPTVQKVAPALLAAILEGYPKDKTVPWTIQVVAPDSKERHDVRRQLARDIDDALAPALDAKLPRKIADSFVDDGEEAQRLAQVWIVDEASALVGFTAKADALTAVPGGRILLKDKDAAPSKSAPKLEEAIAWIGIGPGPGDKVVDLGASPGGWTAVAIKGGATVTAVDKLPLTVTVPPKRVRFVGQDAFAFMPPDTVDWLLCDLAHRPIDVAKLVAKWGRHGWARQVIVSFKLPMKKKAEIVRELILIMADGGWNGIRARQLYFDKDEVTVYSWLDPKMLTRGFRLPHKRPSKD